MAKKRKYGGALDEPLEPLRIGLLMSDDKRNEVVRERIEIETTKLNQLSEHYGLATGDHRSLALALAREHVGGFKEAKPKGRPVKWDLMAKAYLYVDVRRAAEMSVGRDKYAAVAMKPCWAEFIDCVEGDNRDPDPAETVRKKYLEARSDRFAKVAWNAFLMHQHENDIENWDANVSELLRGWRSLTQNKLP